MSCQVAHSPLQPDDWLSDDNSQSAADLDAIAEFNASLNDGQDRTEAETRFDPSSSLFEYQPSGPEHGIFDMTHQQPPSNPRSPYYFSSIEAPPDSGLMAYPSHLQNMHRRSISEPPMDMSASHDIHGFPPVPGSTAPTQMTFHRGGHYLGRPQQARPLKSLPKARGGAKGQAYKMKGKEAYQMQHIQPRYQVRPYMHRAPTSTPAMYGPEMAGPRRGLQSSRVCTPEPGDLVDPQLANPSEGGQRREDAASVTLAVSMEELRSMIEMAVQKAVDACRQNEGTIFGEEKAMFRANQAV